MWYYFHNYYCLFVLNYLLNVSVTKYLHVNSPGVAIHLENIENFLRYLGPANIISFEFHFLWEPLRKQVPQLVSTKNTPEGRWSQSSNSLERRVSKRLTLLTECFPRCSPWLLWPPSLDQRLDSTPQHLQSEWPGHLDCILDLRLSTHRVCGEDLLGWYLKHFGPDIDDLHLLFGPIKYLS